LEGCVDGFEKGGAFVGDPAMCAGEVVVRDGCWKCGVRTEWALEHRCGDLCLWHCFVWMTFSLETFSIVLRGENKSLMGVGLLLCYFLEYWRFMECIEWIREEWGEVEEPLCWVV
jgi:hypothetical protein